MTWLEAVHKLWPGITDEEADAVLWSATAFPMADPKTVIKQVMRARRVGRGMVRPAILRAERDMDQAMRKLYAYERRHSKICEDGQLASK
jgi:hypothetical protein